MEVFDAAQLRKTFFHGENDQCHPAPHGKRTWRAGKHQKIDKLLYVRFQNGPFSIVTFATGGPNKFSLAP